MSTRCPGVCKTLSSLSAGPGSTSYLVGVRIKTKKLVQEIFSAHLPCAICWE